MKKENKRKLIENKGITLVALVITIIVLLILAAVSISLVMGDNGILTRAEEAKSSYELSAEEEAFAMDGVPIVVKDLVEQTNGSLLSIEEARSTDMYSRVKNSRYEDTSLATNNIVTIPAGYRITEDTDKINEGIVIENRRGDQWVWIPVDNPSEMYTILSNPTPLQGDTGVTTIYSSKGGIVSGIARGNTGVASAYREPDILVSIENEENMNTYIAEAGFTSTAEKTALQAFAEDLSSSFYNMIESVKRYGGFYIGRYEICGTVDQPILKKGAGVLRYTDWYGLYKACSKFSTYTATSRMLWDCSYDEVCKFISEKGTAEERVNLSDPRTYGNFLDSQAPANTGCYGSPCPAGSCEAWKTHNIYDIVGNMGELTQCAVGTGARVSRGGVYTWYGETGITAHGGNGPTAALHNAGSRPVLYINP